MIPAPALEVRHVSQRFKLGSSFFARKRILHALTDVSLSLYRGDVLGIVGESGCGKTTLARILLGLLEPSQGTALFHGKPLSIKDRKQRARAIQPIFQDPFSSLNPYKTVAQAVRLPLIVHGIGTAQEQKRIVALMLEQVGLPARLADAYPNQMSGGQRQRVAIARALAIHPQIVICDEPTSALDVSVQSQILNLLLDLRRTLGLTYLFISHNLAVIEHIATRVAVMYLGRIVEEAATLDLFSRPRHPYTSALLASVLTPEPGLGIPDAHLGVSSPNALDLPPGCAFHPRCPRATSLCSQQTPQLRHDRSGRVACHHADILTPEGSP